jgi:hypothetical protein
MGRDDELVRSDAFGKNRLGLIQGGQTCFGGRLVGSLADISAGEQHRREFALSNFAEESVSAR